MHDPIGFGAFWSFAYVKDKSLFDTNLTTFSCDNLVGACGLPIPGPGYSVGSGPVWIFSIPGAEKVPFFLSKNCLACNNTTTIPYFEKVS